MSIEPDRPPRTAAPRRFIAVATVAVIVLAAGIGIALWNGDDSEAPDSGALADAPTLQDLAGSAEETPQSDDAAPDFSVRTADGGAFTLSDHLANDGRPVIVNLWASWCFPCRAEMPAIDSFAAANPDVMVVGVAVQDDPVAAEQFAEEIDVAYTIGFDEKDEVNDSYRPLGLPATFYISADGVVVKRQFGGVTEESLAEDAAALFGN